MTRAAGAVISQTVQRMVQRARVAEEAADGLMQAVGSLSPYHGWRAIAQNAASMLRLYAAEDEKTVRLAVRLAAPAKRKARGK